MSKKHTGRPRRQLTTKSNTNKYSDQVRNTEKVKQLAPQPPRVGQQPIYFLFLTHAKIYLGLFASIVGIVAASWAFFPSLSILPTVTVTDKKPSSVDFTVTNTGRLTVYDLIFSCMIERRGRILYTEGNTVISPDGIMAQGVGELDPGRSATRSCDVGMPIPDVGYPASFDFTIRYVWPFIHKTNSVTRHFTTRLDGDRHIMIVPDSG